MTEQAVIESLTSALGWFMKLIKAASFYPGGHPALENQLRQCSSAFKEVVLEESCQLVIKKRGVFLGSVQLAPADSNMAKLATGIFARRIQKIIFLEDLDPADLYVFVKTITVDPAKIQKLGGIEKLLEEAAVSTVWVNDIDPETIALQRKERQARRAEQLAAVRAQSEGSDTEEESDTSNSSVSTSKSVSSMLDSLLAEDDAAEAASAEEEREAFASLIDKLKAADLTEFPSVIKEIRGCFPSCLNDSPTETMQLFSFLALLSTASIDDRAPEAIKAIDHFSESECMEFVLNHFCDPDLNDEDNTTSITLLVAWGELATNEIMNRLVDEKNVTIRRRLTEALVQQGDIALPVIKRYLADDRWFVVRNVLTILGDIRNVNTIEEIAPLLDHSDNRVRREALRSLTRIGGAQVLSHLVEYAGKGDVDQRRQAILSISALRLAEAVESLVEIYDDLGNSPNDFDLKKDIVKALGDIASPEAILHLHEVLSLKKFWGGTRLEELRALAATGLGNIVTEEAAAILDEFTEDKSMMVAKAATAAMKSLQKG